MSTNLRLRASQAFDAEFRDRLANAVQVARLKWVHVYPNPDGECCPEGCVMRSVMPASRYFAGYPSPGCVARRCGFTSHQHRHFQRAFDAGFDHGTPEGALGLLYRERLMKRG